MHISWRVVPWFEVHADSVAAKGAGQGPDEGRDGNVQEVVPGDHLVGDDEEIEPCFVTEGQEK